MRRHLERIISFLGNRAWNFKRHGRLKASEAVGWELRISGLSSLAVLLSVVQSTLFPERPSRKERETKISMKHIASLAHSLNIERDASLKNKSKIAPILRKVAEFSTWLWREHRIIPVGTEHVDEHRNLLHTYRHTVQKHLPDSKDCLQFTRFQMYLQTRVEQAQRSGSNESAKYGNNHFGESLTDSSRFVHVVEPGWETAVPCLLGGVPHGQSEQRIKDLREQVSRSLRSARLQDTCVFLHLRDNLVILYPFGHQAHLLRFSGSGYIGHFGRNDRKDERSLNELIVEANRNDKIKDGPDKKSLQMITRMEAADKKDGDEIAEYGDLLHCFKGSYLVRLNSHWYIVSNPRWKRIWRRVKVLSKSIRPTALKAFMVGVTWEYVDAERSKLCKLFWGGKMEKGERYLLQGSESLVHALKNFLPSKVVDRVGADVLLSTAQEFIVGTPEITMRLLGPKRCWSQLYSELKAECSEKKRLKGSEQELFMDYYADRGHLVRPASLVFGSAGDQDYIRRWNGSGQWFFAEVEGTSRSIHIGKPVEGIKVKAEKPSKSNRLVDGWSIGERCDH